jgi:hypothetical protein
MTYTDGTRVYYEPFGWGTVLEHSAISESTMRQLQDSTQSYANTVLVKFDSGAFARILTTSTLLRTQVAIDDHTRAHIIASNKRRLRQLGWCTNPSRKRSAKNRT